MKKDLITIIFHLLTIVIAIFDILYLIFLACLVSYLAVGNDILLPYLWKVTLSTMIANTLLLCYIAVYLVFRKQ